MIVEALAEGVQIPVEMHLGFFTILFHFSY